MEPLGRDAPVKVDVRLLATTNVTLKELVREGLLREDFYHRIMVLEIRVPSLRDRREDIPLLISYFVKRAVSLRGSPVPDIPEGILGAMIRYDWPGNVRELKNAVERMVITASDGILGPFSSDQGCEKEERLLSSPSGTGKLRSALENTEKKVIEESLSRHGGVMSEVCRELGISRRALFDRMRRYSLHKRDFKT